MNATSLYVSTCRYILHADHENPDSWGDLYRLLPYLRQSLSCCVCGNLLSDPMGPTNSTCQHHVCKGCIGGKMLLKPSCSWCKDYGLFAENKQLQILLSCYKKLCEYIADTPIARNMVGANGGTSNTLAILQEGMAISEGNAYALSKNNSDDQTVHVNIMELLTKANLDVSNSSSPASPVNGSSPKTSTTNNNGNTTNHITCINTTSVPVSVKHDSTAGHSQKLTAGNLEMSPTATTSSQPTKTCPQSATTLLQSETTLPQSTTTVPQSTTTLPRLMTTSPGSITTSPGSITTSPRSITTSPRSPQPATSFPRLSTSSPQSATISPQPSTTSPHTFSKSNSHCGDGDSYSHSVDGGLDSEGGMTSSASYSVSLSSSGEMPRIKIKRRHKGDREGKEHKKKKKDKKRKRHRHKHLLENHREHSGINSDSPIPPKVKKLIISGHRAKLLKSGRKLHIRGGCRCGTGGKIPGKFTCLGARCPCFVSEMECTKCRCRGCRNPYTKPRTAIPDHVMRQASKEDSDVDIDVTE